MAKVRVHELAKQLGMESKVVLAKLKEMGEFVTSASSTIEPPVARRLIEAFPNANVEAEKKPVKKAATKKAAAKKPEADGKLDSKLAAELAAELGVDLAALKAVEPKPAARPTPSSPASQTNIPKPPAAGARPAGNNPFASPSAMPKPPQRRARPAGNNPFGSSMPQIGRAHV